ncbi:hypothetical protein L915_18438, partial [Phytophthora nicotianae]
QFPQRRRVGFGEFDHEPSERYYQPAQNYRELATVHAYALAIQGKLHFDEFVSSLRLRRLPSLSYLPSPLGHGVRIGLGAVDRRIANPCPRGFWRYLNLMAMAQKRWR